MQTTTAFDLGGITITPLDAGGLKLDGGAMFGIIPKPLWSRRTPADEKNRIQLACRSLLVEWEHETARRAIIETGHGGKYAAKEQAIFEIDASRWLLTSLEERGIDPGTITDVILTHLHFDHAGGLTTSPEPSDFDPARAQSTFPNARVHVQRREFDDARAGFGIMTATYREENYAPIDAADAWRLLDGEEEIVPNVRALPTPGHTRGHHSIVIAGRDRTAAYVGDVLPTAAHVGAPYNMGYDLYPIDNRDSKRALLTRAAAEDWLIIIGHELNTPFVRVIPDRDWFRLETQST